MASFTLFVEVECKADNENAYFTYLKQALKTVARSLKRDINSYGGRFREESECKIGQLVYPD